MNEHFLLWKYAKPIFYMASVAATWIWAPAIFVSSDKAYYSGLSGFLMFLVPNVLTLVLFAFFAEKVRKNTDGFTLSDAIKSAGLRQQRLHIIVSLTVLVCSTCVQLLGLHTLFSAWFEIPKYISALIVSITALLMVWKNGIKGSIQTDFFKYVIMFISGLILLIVTIYNGNGIHLSGLKPVPLLTLLSTFGIPTFIGLFCAPYADQTFWQRVFSIEPNKIKPVFFGSAFLFMLIPLLFGLIGFYAVGGNNWNIALAFENKILQIILAISVLSALLSTLDSNLCAISSIVCADMKQSITIGRISMIILLVLSSTLMIFTNLTITGLFLIYGTIRTCIALPTILIILKKYNPMRLFYATCLCVLIAPIGYILSNGYYIFTILAFIIPILGYQNKMRELE